MSNVKNELATKRGYSRRSIVKGAAWSAPAIAAAIAAPAAAASARSAVVAFSANSGNLLLTPLPGGSGTTSVSATGPTDFSLQNTAGAVSGKVTGSITIAPSSPTLVNLGGRPKGIGVQSITGATVDARTASGGSNGVLGVGALADTTTTTITYNGGVPDSGMLVFPITFGYTASGSILSVALLQTYNVTLVLRDGNGVQIGQIAVATVSSLLTASAS